MFSGVLGLQWNCFCPILGVGGGLVGLGRVGLGVGVGGGVGFGGWLVLGGCVQQISGPVRGSFWTFWGVNQGRFQGGDSIPPPYNIPPLGSQNPRGYLMGGIRGGHGMSVSQHFPVFLVLFFVSPHFYEDILAIFQRNSPTFSYLLLFFF